MLIAMIINIKHDIDLLLFPFLFAAIGSFISRRDSSKEKDGRSITQVLTNAGPALLAVLFIPDQLLARNIVILVFAVALADTMSSELGKRWKGTTIDFCSLKKMEPGLSGGISWQGSAAGLLGSFIIASAAFIYPIDHALFLTFLSFGFIGMLIDSILGSIAQGKYLVGEQMKESGEREELVHGVWWLNNEGVNFISICISVLLAIKWL